MGGKQSKGRESKFVFTDKMMIYAVRAAFDLNFDVHFKLYELTLDEFKEKFTWKILRYLGKFLECIEPMEGTVSFNDTHEKFFYYLVLEFLRIFHDFEVFMKEQSTNTSGISYDYQVFNKLLEESGPVYLCDSSIFQHFDNFLKKQSSDRDESSDRDYVAQAVDKFLKGHVENEKKPSTKSALKRNYKKMKLK